MAELAPLPPPNSPPPEMTPLSPFKQKQHILFQVVSSRIESWGEKTYCARILLRNGAEMEVQASKAALDQWKTIPKYVTYTAEITRSMLKPYKAADKTGIQNEYFLRTQFRVPNLQRAVAAFPLHVVQPRDIADPSNFGQLPEDLIFNVAGVVQHVERPQPSSGPSLARRKVVLANGEWQFTVQFLGELAKNPPAPPTSLVIFSVKKHVWQGVLSLETTRLTWCLDNPPWHTVPEPSEDGPVRKALRTEALPIVSINDVKQANGQEAKCIQAAMLPLDLEVLTTSLWVGADSDRMRLPITLRDATGNLPCTLWSSEFGNFIPKNIDELSTLFAACDEGLAAQTAFLAALNPNADKIFRWTLRPRIWTRDQNEELQWHVADISDEPVG